MTSPDFQSIERHVWAVGAEIAALRDAIRVTEPEDFDGLGAQQLADDIRHTVLELTRAGLEFTGLWDRHEATPLPLRSA